MKRFIGLIIFCASMLICSASYADANGYIMELNGEAPILLMAVDDSVVSIGNSGDYFYAENFDDLIPYMSFAKNICEDFELELLGYPDTTDDPYFPNQWNHPAMKTEAVRKAGLDGSGVKIGIIDSGVNIYHEDLNIENIIYTYDCTTSSADLASANDAYGHGSFVTGTIAAITNNGKGIAGIAPNAELAILKVTNGQTLSVSDLIISVEISIELKCDVLNMSLGVLKDSISDNQFNLLSSIIDKTRENNIIVVSAVGNDTDNYLRYPAAFDSVIGVGSVDKELNHSTFSNYNESVFITVPGEELYSTYKGNSDKYIKWDGTSFAAPEVSAAAAIAKQLKPDLTIEEFKNLLIASADDLGEEGYDTEYGYGLLNFENMIRELQAPAPPQTSQPAQTTAPPQTTQPVQTTAPPSNSPQPAETIIPLNGYADKLTVEKEAEDNKITLTIKPVSEESLILRTFVCVYDNDGRLEGVKIYSPENEDKNLKFVLDIPENENYKIMLWDYHTPVISDIGKI